MSFLWFHTICTGCNQCVRLDETLTLDGKPICFACHEAMHNSP